jgi:hypothetical protein
MIPKAELNVAKINDKGANLIFLNVRLAFVWLSKPQEDLTPGKYSYKVTGLIPKSDFKRMRPDLEKTVQKILAQSSIITGAQDRKDAYVQAMADGKKKSLFKFGDEQTDKSGVVYPGLKDMISFSTHTVAEQVGKDLFRPKVPITLMDLRKQTVPEHDIQAELYAGCYANLAVTLGAYTMGGAGLTFYLNGVMKTADGEKLGGFDPFANIPAAEEGDEGGSSVPDFGEEEEMPKGKAAKKGKK